LSDLHDSTRRWVLVARILRPRGNKGEVVAELLTDYSSRFSTLKQFYLRKGDGQPQPAGLQHFWVARNHSGMGVFHFAGYATISDAEKLRGYEVLLPFEERVSLPAGQYFVTDLIGCKVFEVPVDASKLSSPACAAEEAPRVVGTVRDVYFPGETVAGTPILQVETAAGELLLPLAEDICKKIDVTARRIDVSLPEGLSDVNAREPRA
jgi:16S rRNA processing protein RimM